MGGRGQGMKQQTPKTSMGCREFQKSIKDPQLLTRKQLHNQLCVSFFDLHKLGHNSKTLYTQNKLNDFLGFPMFGVNLRQGGMLDRFRLRQASGLLVRIVRIPMFDNSGLHRWSRLQAQTLQEVRK
jgi:hypothetical protein